MSEILNNLRKNRPTETKGWEMKPDGDQIVAIEPVSERAYVVYADGRMYPHGVPCEPPTQRQMFSPQSPDSEQFDLSRPEGRAELNRARIVDSKRSKRQSRKGW